MTSRTRNNDHKEVCHSPLSGLYLVDYIDYIEKEGEYLTAAEIFNYLKKQIGCKRLRVYTLHNSKKAVTAD